MNVKEFQKYIEKEYLFQKVLDYILASLFFFGGLFFMYTLLLTEWSKNLSLELFIFTLIFSAYIIYFGLVGFLRIPLITEIQIILNNSGRENNRKRIIDISKKYNMFLYPYEINDCIIIMETKKILLAKKELFFYYDDKGIYFNIQHVNFRDPKYGCFYSTRKLINKIKMELSDSK